MKTHCIYLRFFLCILLPFMGYVQAWSTSTTYYGRGTATVSSASPTGSGTVYVSTTNNSTGTYGNTSSATGNSSSQSGSATVTLYAFAKANDNYEFVGWNTANGTNTTSSTQYPYTFSITATSTDENNPTTANIYAIFANKPLYYFSATAVVTPAGSGTATTSPATTSTRGDHWNSTSATTTEIVFSATPNPDYGFTGWSTTANGSITSTANPYNPTLTSTSTNSNSPTNTTLYARFRPYATSITASPSELAVYVGISSSPITHTVSPSGAYDEHTTYESANTAIATVDVDGRVTGVAVGTTTITVNSLKDDNTTIAASTTVTVMVKNKVATPVISFEMDNDGAKAIITCATTGHKIYYTKNGGTPTTSSTEYSSPIPVTEGDVIRAIAVKDPADANWENSDVVTGVCAFCTTDAPEITFEGNSNTGKATVTITAKTGETIYYTYGSSDPADPTISSYDGTGTTSVTINNVSAGSIVKAIAKSTSCQASDVESKEITFSYADGNTVALDDREDHTWTYYSGVEASVDGGNYNTNYAGKLYSPNPRNVKITYKANGGVVSIDESETEFVYYKTLEQGTTAGQYPYTVISNPFSKRPNGKGFGGWKIKEGAEYINGYNDEAILPLDADIVFTNLPYTSVNCTSAEIELEATWVNYNNRTYASGNTFTYSVTGGTYETNFLVLNRNVTGTITVSSPCTIMMVEPDGSADYRNSYTFTGNISPNNNGVTKIEFTKWSSTNTVDANYKHLWIGRGMTTTSQCATLITGINTNDQTAGTKFSIKVESGKYDYFDFYKGHSTYTGGTANTGGTASGTAANAIITIGNDYDRAKANTNNQNLEIKYGPMLGYSFTFNNRDNRDNEHTLDLTVKSGRIGYTFFMEDTNTGNYLQGGAGYCMYLSSAGSQTNVGRRNVLIEGGDICTIGSGIDSYNNAPSNNDNVSTTTNYNRLAFNVRIKGGTIHGNVYGGAAQSPSGGNRVMVMTGGQVKGWFAAGCNGTGNDGGQNYGTSWVYIGGKGKVDSEGSTKVLGYASGGNVYAAGAGRTGTTTCGEMTFGSNLVIADESYIERGAYGGGNYGYALSETNIYITGGTNEGKDGTVNAVTTKGGVFGGANQQNGPGINMYMTGGLMKGGVYGGCNTQGTISNSVTMNINGGQVGTPSSPANIHGGGYGAATRVTQNVDITLGSTTQTTSGVTVYGDVYGGSALGYVNGTAATDTYHTNVTLNNGIINGSLYGGGLGDGGTQANVYGPVEVKVYGGSVRKTDSNGANGSGGVYGANNVNGAPQRSVKVDIYGTDPAPSENEYALFAVYGGGNAADYTYGNGYPKVTVHNCDNSIEYVYGGGNAAAVAATDVTIYGGNKIGTVFGGGNGSVTAANVNGDAVTKIYGGTIGKVFGGSNSQGSISGDIRVTVVKQAGDEDPDGSATACEMHIDEVYGGGNMANSQAGSISIGCTGNEGEGIGDVYGGANQANITGDISLEITGGSIERVFGGNNASGSISGGIQVDVNWATTDPCGYNHIGSVFGAGNLAQYTIPSGKTLAVNILNGTVSGNVYGGGKGLDTDHSKGQVTGNPVVTIGDNTSGHENYVAAVTGDVYGGGDAGNVVGTPVVNVINKCNTTIGNVYGGGNAADVNGTNVNIDGGTISHDVYGGGHGDLASLNTGGETGHSDKAANVSGAVSVSITGGTINRVFGGSNTNGNISGDVSVEVQKGANSCEMHITELYGGGNLAAGNAGAISIGCTGDEGEGIGDVYGGANAANITGDISLEITGGSIERVFGGNNASGTISGGIEVKINWTEPTTCGHNYLGYVYGAGREADYGGDPVVNIINGTVSHDVYGGGLLADVVGTVEVNMTGGAVLGDLYGGGALANTNTGSNKTTAVNLTGGTVNNVYGGGLGRLADAANNITAVEALVGGAVTVTLNGSVVTGSIFGCNNINGTPKGHVKVWVVKTVDWEGHAGTARDDRYDESATHNYHVAAVYGGGNMAAYVPTSNTDFAEVVIDGCDVTSIQTVYGGGNAASTPATSVRINGSYEIEEVFGGGNGLSSVTKNGVTYPNPGANVGYKDYSEYYQEGGVWKVRDKADADTKDERQRDGSPYVYGTGEANVNIYGGTIHRVFGGSNTKGNVRYTAVTMLENNDGCEFFLIDEAYGGGKSAPMDAEAKLLMSCIPGLKAVYGGAQAADIMGNVVLNVTNGTFERVFGGNNISGTISGSITVNIEETGCKPIIIGELYGGGNQAAYSVYGYNADKSPKEPGAGTKLYHDPVINVKSFTSIGDIFGGGYGSTAKMVGSPTVNISVAEGRWKDYVGIESQYDDDGYEYDATGYKGITTTIDDHKVIIPNHAAGKIGAIQRVFGGGNAAEVHGNTNINIGTLSEVYVTVPDNEITVGTTNPTNVSSYFTRTGEGTTASPYVYAAATGTAAAGVTYYQKLSVVGADIRGNVFGGGNAAEVSGDTNIVVGKTN